MAEDFICVDHHSSACALCVKEFRSQVAELKAEVARLKGDNTHMLMFFQVAVEALGIDPSCEPGKIDLMCTADAILAKDRKIVELLAEIDAARSCAHVAHEDDKCLKEAYEALKQSLAEEGERFSALLDQLVPLANALPPNAISMGVAKALLAYKKAGSDHIPDAGKKVGP